MFWRQPERCPLLAHSGRDNRLTLIARQKIGPPLRETVAPRKAVLFGRTISLGTRTSRCTPREYIGLQFHSSLHARTRRRGSHCKSPDLHSCPSWAVLLCKPRCLGAKR